MLRLQKDNMFSYISKQNNMSILFNTKVHYFITQNLTFGLNQKRKINLLREKRAKTPSRAMIEIESSTLPNYSSNFVKSSKYVRSLFDQWI